MGLDAVIINGAILVLVGAPLYLGLRAVRALERRKVNAAEVAALTARLEAAEREAAAIAAGTAALADRQARAERQLHEAGATHGLSVRPRGTP